MTTLSPQQSDCVQAFAGFYGDNRPSFHEEQRTEFDSEGNSSTRVVQVVDRVEGALPEHTPMFNQCGYAGTGKSTILPFFIEAIGVDPSEIAFCAPTGKAAKVMTEKLAAQGINEIARTIHSTIYKPSQVAIETIEREIALWEAAVDNLRVGRPSFATIDGRQPTLREAQDNVRRHHKRLNECYAQDDVSFLLNDQTMVREKKLIVVDECSMVGTKVAHDILSYGVPVLAIGDPGQLPPIKDKWGLIKRVPDGMLTEIHRQAADNPIIALSKMVREGRWPGYGTMGDGQVRIIPSSRDDATYDITRDAQLIVGTHRKRSMITKMLRKRMGFDSTGPMEGDQLLITRNSKLYPNLVNGSFVICKESIGDLGDFDFEKVIPIETAQGDMRLDCSLHELRSHYKHLNDLDEAASNAVKRRIYDARQNNHHIDYGWAITCHKSQGSQWENITLHDESGVFKQDAKRWLYTGVTRAAETLVVVR